MLPSKSKLAKQSFQNGRFWCWTCIRLVGWRLWTISGWEFVLNLNNRRKKEYVPGFNWFSLKFWVAVSKSIGLAMSSSRSLKLLNIAASPPKKGCQVSRSLQTIRHLFWAAFFSWYRGERGTESTVHASQCMEIPSIYIILQAHLSSRFVWILT